ncbi:MAG: FliM/FliN family flagellar motor switch protein [Actinomycetota bacterium]|nr:FliM/FliN family flagellar motor switch protein [Actinomycetota bacterium]
MSATLLPAGDPRVRPYDFNNQEVIERARIRRIQPVIEAAAQRMAGALSTQLRQPVHIALAGVEQSPWVEFRQEMEDPTFIAVATVPALDGRIVLHVPVECANALVDVLLSGSGGPQPDRALSDLDVELIGALADDMFSGLEAAIESFFEFKIAAVQRLRSAVYVRVRRPGEACLKFAMDVEIGDCSPRTVHLYWPFSAFHPVLDAFDLLQREAEGARALRSMNVERRLLSVPVKVQVSYPSVKMGAAEILELRPDDVITLGIDALDKEPHLEIIVGGALLGRGRHVEVGSRLACTIAAWKEEP